MTTDSAGRYGDYGQAADSYGDHDHAAYEAWMAGRITREYDPGCILAARDHDHMGVCSACWSLGQAQAGTTNGPDVLAAIAGAESGHGDPPPVLTAVLTAAAREITR